mgnify:CR=1 FL=1
MNRKPAKVLTPSQKNWRAGYFTGIERANGLPNSENLVYVDADELEQLRNDANLLSVMRGIGVDDRESRMYWHGMEQAAEIYCDLYRPSLPTVIDIGYPEYYL